MPRGHFQITEIPSRLLPGAEFIEDIPRQCTLPNRCIVLDPAEDGLVRLQCGVFAVEDLQFPEGRVEADGMMFTTHKVHEYVDITASVGPDQLISKRIPV